MTRLDRELDRAEREDRRKALRALLARPLLSADDSPRELSLVRRHAAWLREWLAKYPGWRLHVESEMARLRKTPADLDDGTRPARDPRSGEAFSRRRYVLLCLALAALERSDRQTTLGKLAEAIMTFAGDPALGRAGIHFDLRTQEQRRDLVKVVRLLLDLRVLVRVHGDEEKFVRESGDVLYDIRRPILVALLDVQRGPSTVEATSFEERLASITEEPLAESEEGRNRRLRARLCRRLLDDPILDYDRLAEDEAAYLQTQRPHLVREIHEATGLVGEARNEGLAMVDERGDVTDLGLPEEGTDGHLALLLAEFLADHARRRGDRAIARAAIERHVKKLIDEHRKHWRKNVRDPGAEKLLAGATLERLAALGLVRFVEGGVVARPAIGRFALDPREDDPPPNPELPFADP